MHGTSFLDGIIFHFKGKVNIESFFFYIYEFQARDIRAKDQIRVQKGDVIGIHYPKKLPKYQRCGVLAFENQLMEVRIFKLGHIYSEQQR